MNWDLQSKNGGTYLLSNKMGGFLFNIRILFSGYFYSINTKSRSFPRSLAGA